MRKFANSLILAAAFSLTAAPVFAAEEKGPAKPAEQPAADKPEAGDHAVAPVVEYSVSRKRSIPFHGSTLAYTVTPGTLTIRDDEGEVLASIFYTAYVMDQPAGAKPRPVTFVYNGGPGSSTMWLHMGSYGPLKMDVPGLANTHGEPGHLIPNQDTILDRTDLVFIDAPNTGLSRPLGKHKSADFGGVDPDLDAFARAIQRYLTINGRWSSPKFLLGESYGTTRTGGLSYTLESRGVRLAGVTIMSTVLNIPLLFNDSIDQPNINILPTFAASAWYHNRVPNRSPDIATHVNKAWAFATGPYAAALAKGDAISPEELNAVAKQAGELIGVSPEFMIRNHLRPGASRWRKELLRDQDKSVGRLDSRFALMDADAGGAEPEFDAANEEIAGPFIAAINEYLFNDLGYKTNLSYRPNFYGGTNWDWKHRAPDRQVQMVANTSVDLGQAMRQNPKLKLLSLNGYYDLATPFAGAIYDIQHMELDPSLKQNITIKYYESGHMIYIEPNSAHKLREDITAFYDSVTK